MIDAAMTVDAIKLRFYIDWLYQSHITDEGDSDAHNQLTKKVVSDYVEPLKLKKTDKIVDLGCGPGYFLDIMKSKGYNNIVGITLSDKDAKTCQEKGHEVQKIDMSFLSHKKGYNDESVDFFFMRHALEHSPYPIISLIEYNRVLKQNGKIYIEVPAPNCQRKHEWNPNHYSILGPEQLSALLHRTGFQVDKFQTMKFDMSYDDPDSKEKSSVIEEYYCIVATKKHSLDIK